MRTLLLSFAIVGLLCGCSSKSDYGEARGIVCDATMNTVTIVTDDNDTLSFSTVATDKSGVDGLLLGDTAEITYRGKYEKGMGALKMVSYPQRALLGGDRDEHGCIGSAGYVWSEVSQDCIRVFEKGIRTESVRGDNRSVYIVFSPDSSQVELFFSDGQPNEILERRTLPSGGFAWNVEDDDTKNVRFINGLWTIEQRGEVIYREDSAAADSAVGDWQERTYEGVLPAADTPGIVINCHPGVIVLLQTAHRTGHHTRSVVTVGASCRKIGAIQHVATQFLIKNPAQRQLPRLHIGVVLIHAGHRTGMTGAAPLGVKHNIIFHITHLHFPDVAARGFIPRKSGIRVLMLIADHLADIGLRIAVRHFDSTRMNPVRQHGLDRYASTGAVDLHQIAVMNIQAPRVIGINFHHGFRPDRPGPRDFMKPGVQRIRYPTARGKEKWIFPGKFRRRVVGKGRDIDGQRGQPVAFFIPGYYIGIKFKLAAGSGEPVSQGRPHRCGRSVGHLNRQIGLLELFHRQAAPLHDIID